MARSLLALCLLLGCATTGSDRLDPHNPGERCIDSCPEGMLCTGTSVYRAPKKTFPGQCQLRPGRCATDSDCSRSQRCVRTSNQLGLCAEAPQL
ncbi:MAG TPA: hypothetical protein VH853_06095 [Polyangia bacterium]|nr:hypothetical protein [Polyangia bacterium]